MISNLSGFFLSTIIPHIIDEIMNIPPYAAYVLPKWDGWSVGRKPIPFIQFAKDYVKFFR